MSVIVFDVELTGTYNDDAMNSVIVHHESFEQASFPITHILNVASDELGWHTPWMELRCQKTGNALALMHYEKDSGGHWQKVSVTGTIPELHSRVDLYLLDHQPNRSIDAFLEV
jgi:hypothetical protein